MLSSLTMANIKDEHNSKFLCNSASYLPTNINSMAEHSVSDEDDSDPPPPVNVPTRDHPRLQAESTGTFYDTSHLDGGH